MKIGILGGSFDPIHNGHLHMAIESYHQYKLDEVWLMPNGNAPHKDSTKMADAMHRLNMCHLAAKSYPFLKVCDIETSFNSCSYSYLTMTKLAELYPNDEFYFIMGADSLDYFDKWKKPEVIASLCKILVINREEFSDADMQEKIQKIQSIFPADIRIVSCAKVDISSTEIRKNLKKEDLPAEVYAYIYANHLYQM